MLSDISSLTDISSDESFVPPNKGRKSTGPGPKAKAKVKGQYMLKNCLKAPRATTYSAKALYDYIHEGAIDLNPEYQREVVWPEAKQTGLIDSILRNYYMPPVIFADDGSETRICIDGKQRLTSIQRFMDGMIPHKDSQTNAKLWYKCNNNSKSKLLPQQYRNQFANKQVVCVEYEGLSEDAEREIFQRVQLGVALTPAERMQAIPGPWSALIRDIQTEVLGEHGFGDNLDWATSRGRDFQCLASIVYFIEKLPGATTHPGAQQLDKWLQRVTPPTKEFRNKTMDVFKVFVALVRDKKHNTPFQKPTRVAPIEFVMAGTLISQYMDLSLAQLSQAITKMRADVRSVYKDIRANSSVVKYMCGFILDRFPKNLKGDGMGDRPAIQVVKTLSNGHTNPAKRKRTVSDSDDEDSDNDVSLRTKAISSMKKASMTEGEAKSSRTSQASTKSNLKTNKIEASAKHSVPKPVPRPPDLSQPNIRHGDVTGLNTSLTPTCPPASTATVPTRLPTPLSAVPPEGLPYQPAASGVAPLNRNGTDTSALIQFLSDRQTQQSKDRKGNTQETLAAPNMSVPPPSFPRHFFSGPLPPPPSTGVQPYPPPPPPASAPALQGPPNGYYRHTPYTHGQRQQRTPPSDALPAPPEGRSQSSSQVHVTTPLPPPPASAPPAIGASPSSERSSLNGRPHSNALARPASASRSGSGWDAPSYRERESRFDDRYGKYRERDRSHPRSTSSWEGGGGGGGHPPHEPRGYRERNYSFEERGTDRDWKGSERGRGGRDITGWGRGRGRGASYGNYKEGYRDSWKERERAVD